MIYDSLLVDSVGKRGGAGNQIANFVPRPGALSMSIEPPWASIIFRAVGSPRPEPPCFVE